MMTSRNIGFDDVGLLTGILSEGNVLVIGARRVGKTHLAGRLHASTGLERAVLVDEPGKLAEAQSAEYVIIDDLYDVLQGCLRAPEGRSRVMQLSAVLQRSSRVCAFTSPYAIEWMTILQGLSRCSEIVREDADNLSLALKAYCETATRCTLRLGRDEAKKELTRPDIRNSISSRNMRVGQALSSCFLRYSFRKEHVRYFGKTYESFVPFIFLSVKGLVAGEGEVLAEVMEEATGHTLWEVLYEVGDAIRSQIPEEVRHTLGFVAGVAPVVAGMSAFAYVLAKKREKHGPAADLEGIFGAMKALSPPQLEDIERKFGYPPRSIEAFLALWSDPGFWPRLKARMEILESEGGNEFQRVRNAVGDLEKGLSVLREAVVTLERRMSSLETKVDTLSSQVEAAMPLNSTEEAGAWSPAQVVEWLLNHPQVKSVATAEEANSLRYLAAMNMGTLLSLSPSEMDDLRNRSAIVEKFFDKHADVPPIVVLRLLTDRLDPYGFLSKTDERGFWISTDRFPREIARTLRFLYLAAALQKAIVKRFDPGEAEQLLTRLRQLARTGAEKSRIIGWELAFRTLLGDFGWLKQHVEGRLMVLQSEHPEYLQDLEVLDSLVRALFVAGMNDLALKELDKAGKQWPGWSEYLRLQLAWEELDDLRQGLQRLSASSSDVISSIAKAQLAGMESPKNLLDSQKRVAEAASRLPKLVENLPVLFAKETSLTDVRQAAEQMEEMLKDDSLSGLQKIPLLAHAARFHAQGGNSERARRILKEIRAITEGAPARIRVIALHEIAEVLMMLYGESRDMNLLDEAHATVAEVLALGPPQEIAVVGRVILATVGLLRGDRAKFEKETSELLNEVPLDRTPNLIGAIAWAYVLARDYDAAVKLTQKLETARLTPLGRDHVYALLFDALWKQNRMFHAFEVARRRFSAANSAGPEGLSFFYPSLLTLLNAFCDILDRLASSGHIQERDVFLLKHERWFVPVLQMDAPEAFGRGLERYLRHKTKLVLTRYGQGYLGDLSAYRTTLEKACESDEKKPLQARLRPVVLLLLGEVEYSSRRFESAKGYFQKALASLQNSQDLAMCYVYLTGISVLETRMGRSAEETTERYIEKAQSLQPTAETYYGLARMCNLWGDPRRAEALYEKAIARLNEADEVMRAASAGMFWLGYSHCLAALGQVEKAGLAAEHALSEGLSPDERREAENMRIASALETGRVEDARRILGDGRAFMTWDGRDYQWVSRVLLEARTLLREQRSEELTKFLDVLDHVHLETSVVFHIVDRLLRLPLSLDRCISLLVNRFDTLTSDESASLTHFLQIHSWTKIIAARVRDEEVSRDKFRGDETAQVPPLETAAAFSREADPKERLMVGGMLFAMGRFSDAASTLATLKDQGMNNWLLLQWLGESLRFAGRPDEALPVFEELRKRPGCRLWAHGVIGEIYASRGENETAEKVFLEIENASAEPAVRLLAQESLARLHFQARQWNEAIRWLDLALATAPRRGTSWSLRGRIEFLLGDVQAAEGSLRRAVEAESEIASHHHNLAHVLDMEGQQGEASGEFRQAMTLDAADPRHAQCLDIRQRQLLPPAARTSLLEQPEFRRLVAKEHFLICDETRFNQQ